MATASDIATSISNTIQANDNSVDVTKGPYFDTVITPPANELATISAEQQRIGTLYSRMVDVSNTLNATEISALGRAFSVPMPTGTKATVLLTFYTTSIPNQSLTIPIGTPVSTSDGRYIFTTTQLIQGITADNINAYFDAMSGRYLIPVQAVAVAEGTGYNLPAMRLNRMLLAISGISGVYNPTSSTGGVTAYTASDYLTQVQSAFYGRDTGSLNGLLTEMQRRGVTSPLMFVSPSQSNAFFRPALGSSLDVYLSDTQPTAADETIAALGRTSLVLTYQPVLSVTAVYVNGTLLDTSLWSVSYDTSNAFALSSRSTTSVNIATSTSTSDLIRVTYTYSGSTYNLQQSLDDQDLMGADILPRILRPLNVAIQAQVNCTASTLSAVTASLLTYATTPFLNRIAPADAYTSLRNAYSDIKQIKWLLFDVLNGTNINPINVPPGLIPTFNSPTDLSVTLARS